MTFTDHYHAKLKLRAERPRTKTQLLADEVIEYIGAGKMPYSRLMKLIKENGERCIREILQEMKSKDRDTRAIPIRNRAAYFLKLVAINKTDLKEVSSQQARELRAS